MVKKIILTMVLSACILFTVEGQHKTSALSNSGTRIHDDVLGISFAKIGSVSKLDNSTYRISLSTENSPVQSAIATVSLSDRLFIDLPGSYGGRVYLDSPAGLKLLKNRMKVDTVNISGRNFRREYWAVYAGMGMWDCVINCYSKEYGKYYIVSLVQDKPVGKPGMIVGGKQITSDEMKSKAVVSLQDTTNGIINKFNNLISSLQIQNK